MGWLVSRDRRPLPVHLGAALSTGIVAAGLAAAAWLLNRIADRIEGIACTWDDEEAVMGIIGPSFSLLMVDPDDGEVVPVPVADVGLRLDEGWGLADETEQDEATGCWD